MSFKLNDYIYEKKEITASVSKKAITLTGMPHVLERALTEQIKYFLLCQPKPRLLKDPKVVIKETEDDYLIVLSMNCMEEV